MIDTRRWLAGSAVATAAAAALLGGCAGLEPKLVKDGLAAADADRATIEHLLASPEIQRATQTLTRSVLDAALEDLTAGQRSAQVRALAGDFAAGVLPAIGSALDRPLPPALAARLTAALREAAATAVQAGLDQALRPENRQRAAAYSADLAAAATRPVTPAVSAAIADGVRRGITRAVERVLARDVAPLFASGGASPGGAGGAGAAGAPGAGESPLAAALRTGSREAFLGLADALHGALGAELRQQRQELVDQVQRAAATERQAWIGEIHAERDTWLRNFVVLAVVAALLFLGLLAAILGLSHLVRENRRLRGLA